MSDIVSKFSNMRRIDGQKYIAVDALTILG
jgi:hypothetical protein